MVQIVGKYQYVSSENFEDYIKSLGKADLADAFLQATPVVEIQQNGDQWIVVVTSQGKTVTATFKLGEVYDEQLPSQGLIFKVGSSPSSSPLLLRERWGGGYIALIVRVEHDITLLHNLTLRYYIWTIKINVTDLKLLSDIEYNDLFKITTWKIFPKLRKERFYIPRESNVRWIICVEND